MDNYLPAIWQYLQDAASQAARNAPPRYKGGLPARIPPNWPAPINAGLPAVPQGGAVGAPGGGSLLENILGGLQNRGGSRLVNGWPTMIEGGAQKLLPSPANLPAVVRSGLPAAVRSGLPAVAARYGAASALGGPIGQGALAAADVMTPQPTNSGEVPFYVMDPATGKLVPNAAAFPQVGTGYGGGDQTPRNMPAPGSPSMGANYPSNVPLPRPRPYNAPQGPGQYEGNVASPANPYNNGVFGMPGQTAGPSLIQKMLALFQQGNPSPGFAGPFNGAPSAMGANG